MWTLGRAWEAVRRSWYIIVGLATVFGISSFLYSSTLTPMYEARATLFFSLSQGETVAELTQGSTYTQNQMVSFARLATSSSVLEPVTKELELGLTPRQLARDITVINPPGTVILEVQAGSASPQTAADVANGVAASLTTVVGEVAMRGTDEASIGATLVDDAVVPQNQASPNKRRDALLGSVLGFGLGLLVAFMRVLLDNRVQTPAALARATNRPVLGSVSSFSREPKNPGIIVARYPLGTVAEDFRRIRSALNYSAVENELKRLLVTSYVPGEGKSTFVANFAITLADLEQRVLLIDGDLRRPSVAKYFGTEGSVGLTTVLTGEVSFEEAIEHRPGTTLDLLPSGVIPPNPAQLLGSESMRSLLEDASQRYDYVILDSPPMGKAADATVLAPMVDGVVIVVDARRARRGWVVGMMTEIEASGGLISGLVLNRVRGRKSNYYTTEPREQRRRWIGSVRR